MMPNVFVGMNRRLKIDQDGNLQTNYRRSYSRKRNRNNTEDPCLKTARSWERKVNEC